MKFADRIIGIKEGLTLFVFYLDTFELKEVTINSIEAIQRNRRIVFSNGDYCDTINLIIPKIHINFSVMDKVHFLNKHKVTVGYTLIFTDRKEAEDIIKKNILPALKQESARRIDDIQNQFTRELNRFASIETVEKSYKKRNLLNTKIV